MMRDEKSESSTEFLIQEFNALQSRAIALEEIKSSRVNFFLIIVAAVIAGGASIYEIKLPIWQILILIALVALFLFVLGVATLIHSIDYSAAIVILHRRAGRIRRWFVNENSEIERYVAFEPNDDRPKFDSSIVSWRGGEAVILIINSLSLSIVTTIVSYSLAYYLLWFPLVYGIVIIVFIMAFAITWLWQKWFIHRRLKKGDLRERKNAYFPLIHRIRTDG